MTASPACPVNNRWVQPWSMTTLLALITTRRISAHRETPMIAVGWAHCSRACHFRDGIRAAFGFGSAQFGDIDIAVAVLADGSSAVVVEFAVDEPGEDLRELRPADLVETRVQRPAAVGVLVRHRVTALTVAFGSFCGADRICQRLPHQCSAFELDIRHVHRASTIRFHTPTVSTSGSMRGFAAIRAINRV